MRRLLSFLAPFLLATGLSGPLAAAPGALDRSFGAGFGYIRYADSTNTVNDQGLGVAAQADGKVLVAGTSGIDKAAIVRDLVAWGIDCIITDAVDIIPPD